LWGVPPAVSKLVLANTTLHEMSDKDMAFTYSFNIPAFSCYVFKIPYGKNAFAHHHTYSMHVPSQTAFGSYKIFFFTTCQIDHYEMFDDFKIYCQHTCTIVSNLPLKLEIFEKIVLKLINHMIEVSPVFPRIDYRKRKSLSIFSDEHIPTLDSEICYLEQAVHFNFKKNKDSRVYFLKSTDNRFLYIQHEHVTDSCHLNPFSLSDILSDMFSNYQTEKLRLPLGDYMDHFLKTKGKCECFNRGTNAIRFFNPFYIEDQFLDLPFGLSNADCQDHSSIYMQMHYFLADESVDPKKCKCLPN